MPKATKRGDAWRVQVYDFTDAEGKRHYKSITAPTKVEAQYLAAEFAKCRKLRTVRNDSDLTLAEAVDKYIELKSLLSPTTLTGYRRMRKYAFQDIMNMKVSKIDDLVMQSAVNREAVRVSEKTGQCISVKTLKEEYSLIASSLRTVCHKEIHISKLEKQRHIKEYPEINQVVQALKGSAVELPCLLSLWLSFSMSEIRGLKCSDINNGTITINRVVVDTDQGSVIKENAKVDTRLRKHELPPYLMELIEKTPEWAEYKKNGTDAFLFHSRDPIFKKWKKVCRDNNLGDLTFHDLRHLNASMMLFLGVPEKYAMERGGWKSPNIMKSVYQHTLSDERKKFDGVINDYLGDLVAEK